MINHTIITAVSTGFECLNLATLQLIQLLHPASNGFVAFALSGDEDDFRPCYAVRSSRLSGNVPLNLAKNSYVSINQAGEVWQGRSKDLVTGTPKHREETIQFFCACTVDLDYYKLGYSEEEAVSAIAQLQADGKLPACSIQVHGRGLWLLWLLHEENADNKPVAFTKANLELYKRIQPA